VPGLHGWLSGDARLNDSSVLASSLLAHVIMLLTAHAVALVSHSACLAAPTGNFRVLVLRQGATIVTAATIRFFGIKFAEMPFVATKEGYRRSGNCKRLMRVRPQLPRFRCLITYLGDTACCPLPRTTLHCVHGAPQAVIPGSWVAPTPRWRLVSGLLGDCL
jgi:hypothetical protein